MKNNVSFISEIIKLIQMEKYYGISERMEIAKGKYELNNNIKFLKEQIKRKIKMFKYERIKN